MRFSPKVLSQRQLSGLTFGLYLEDRSAIGQRGPHCLDRSPLTTLTVKPSGAVRIACWSRSENLGAFGRAFGLPD